MKIGINCIFGVTVAFAFAGCGRPQLAPDLVNNNVQPVSDNTFMVEQIRQQETLLGLNFPELTNPDSIPHIDFGQLEADRSEDMEKNLQKISSASVMVGIFGVSGAVKPEICILIAASKDVPETMKREYAQSYETQVILGKVTRKVQEQKVSGFNSLADLWQNNINIILKKCLSNETPEEPEDDGSRDLNVPKYNLV